MEGLKYLHLDIRNMVTIWIMVLAMGAISGFAATAWKSKFGSN